MNTDLNDDGRSRRWDAHRAARRRELVKLAVSAIDELGPQASMEEIAVWSKTSKSVFYRYFEDKAGLQEAVSNRVLRKVGRSLLQAVEQEQEAAAALAMVIGAYLELIEQSPNVYSFVTSDFSSENIRGFFKTITEHMADSLALLLADGEIDPLARAVTVQYWPAAAVGTIRAVSETWLYAPAEMRPPLTEVRDQLTGWLLYGVTASGIPRGSGVVVPLGRSHGTRDSPGTPRP